MDRPIPFRWQGDSFTPLNSHWARQADKELVVGQVYNLVHVEERTLKSLRHMFAIIREGFHNLPPHLSERFQNTEALRKYCLIQNGYCDERSIVCSSKAEAQRIAAFVKPMDEYALVVAKENVVKVYTAQSQSTKAMDKKTFGESKQKVLDTIAAMIGVTTEALASTAVRDSE
jgi:hypothetical protein